MEINRTTLEEGFKYHEIKGRVIDELDDKEICNKPVLKPTHAGIDFLTKKPHVKMVQSFNGRQKAKEMKSRDYFKRQYIKRRLLSFLGHYYVDEKTRDILEEIPISEYPINEIEAKEFCRKVMGLSPFHQTMKYSLFDWLKMLVNNKRVYLKFKSKKGKEWSFDLDFSTFAYPKTNPNGENAIIQLNKNSSFNTTDIASFLGFTTHAIATSITSALTITGRLPKESSTESETNH